MCSVYLVWCRLHTLPNELHLLEVKQRHSVDHYIFEPYRLINQHHAWQLCMAFMCSVSSMVLTTYMNCTHLYIVTHASLS